MIEAILIGETQRCIDRDGKLPMRWDSWCLTLGEAYGLDASQVQDTLSEHGLCAATTEAFLPRCEGK